MVERQQSFKSICNLSFDIIRLIFGEKKSLNMNPCCLSAPGLARGWTTTMEAGWTMFPWIRCSFFPVRLCTLLSCWCFWSDIHNLSSNTARSKGRPGWIRKRRADFRMCFKVRTVVCVCMYMRDTGQKRDFDIFECFKDMAMVLFFKLRSVFGRSLKIL